MATTTPAAKGATRTGRPQRTGKAGSTLFLKSLMAGSGIVFVLFVIGHMLGNLKMLAGHHAFNEYAEHLRTIGQPMLPRHGLLTIMEILLVLCLVAHVWSASQLWKRAKRARPAKYAVTKRKAASPASKAMRWGGVALLLFVIFHLLQFTLPKINFAGGPTHDPYNLVHASFRIWWVALIYIAAMIALGLHLWHGVWSAAQTLGGTSTASARKVAKTVAAVVAAVVVVGFLIPPLSVLFHII